MKIQRFEPYWTPEELAALARHCRIARELYPPPPAPSGPRTDLVLTRDACGHPILARAAERVETAPEGLASGRFAYWWEQTWEIRGLLLLLLILCLMTLAVVAYLDASMAPVIEGVGK
jgi:hypothetical protein